MREGLGDKVMEVVHLRGRKYVIVRGEDKLEVTTVWKEGSENKDISHILDILKKPNDLIIAKNQIFSKKNKKSIYAFLLYFDQKNV